MKKKSLLLLALTTLTLPLMGCDNQNTTSISTMVKTAVDSLKEKTHTANISQSVTITKDEVYESEDTGEDKFQPVVVDIFQEYNNSFTYFYENNERAFSRTTSSLFADLDKSTGQKIESTIREYQNSEEFYFKNNENGTAYTEEIDVKNNLISYTVATYDENTGLYTPILFDYEFKNPFDFIAYRDVQIKEDGKTLTLINQKADFLADCYQTIGLNFIDDNTIYLDNNGRISSIEFTISDLVGDTFTRKNTFSINYSFDSSSINHLEPFKNNNPELQEALDVLDNKKNFTYIKEYLESEETDANGKPVVPSDKITGYFTENEVYFHHLENKETGIDEHPYAVGDLYDYKSVLNENGTYTCYEYTPDGVQFKWGIVKASGSSDYIIDNFEGIGPSFMNLDASIFTKIDDKTYEIEPLLLPSIGKYFDYGMLGVQSYVFDGNTTKLSITLNDEGEIDVIDAWFVFEMVTYKIKFTIKDIGTTEIPEWSNVVVPVPTYTGE